MADIECDVAQYNIFGEHERVDSVLVDRKGESLPFATKYQRKDATSIPVEFSVSKKLEVASIEWVSKKGLENTVDKVSSGPPQLQFSHSGGSADVGDEIIKVGTRNTKQKLPLKLKL